MIIHHNKTHTKFKIQVIIVIIETLIYKIINNSNNLCIYKLTLNYNNKRKKSIIINSN